MADTVWLHALSDEPKATLITGDIALFNVANSRGFKVVNFTDLQSFE